LVVLRVRLNNFFSLHLHPQLPGEQRSVERHNRLHRKDADNRSYGDMCESRTALQAQTERKCPWQHLHHANMSLDSLKKATLQEMLHDHGEDPPERWTKVELRQRLVEIQPSLGLKGPNDHDTELRGMIRRINQAKKKEDLIRMCEGDLQLILTGNETVAQLERRAVEQAHRLSAADGRDYVGFGKHAALQYMDINRYQPSYRAWVLQTDAERAGADYRLRRLASWLRENPVPRDQETHREMTVKAKVKAVPKRRTIPVEEEMELPMNTIDTELASASSATPAANMEQMASAISQLAGVIQNLQHDMNDLKEERPRKKDSKDKSRQTPSEATSEGYTKVENT